MSPIEAELYDVMYRASLKPVPQFCVQGFFLDFAFPGLGLAVEADGAVHLDPRHLQRDHTRDSILRKDGSTILRFHGTTIVQQPDSCAFVVHREFDHRTRLVAELSRLEEGRRAARKEARGHPVRTLPRWLLGSESSGPTPPDPLVPPSA